MTITDFALQTSRIQPYQFNQLTQKQLFTQLEGPINCSFLVFRITLTLHWRNTLLQGSNRLLIKTNSFLERKVQM